MNARSSFATDACGAASGWPSAPCPVPPRGDVPVHDARHLTGATGQAQIVLDGQVYALRITRAGKLILTK